jgi:hypothetical protein
MHEKARQENVHARQVFGDAGRHALLDWDLPCRAMCSERRESGLTSRHDHWWWGLPQPADRICPVITTLGEGCACSRSTEGHVVCITVPTGGDDPDGLETYWIMSSVSSREFCNRLRACDGTRRCSWAHLRQRVCGLAPTSMIFPSSTTRERRPPG